MINQLKIKDFQSHKESVLDFSPGINSIIGQSDCGKTAILRALNWIVNNKPDGIGFKRRGTEEVSVSLSFDDKLLIERFKSKNKNIIKKNGTEYETIGKENPEDINGLINLSNINIQYQMDSPFLLSDTAGEVGKYLNKLVNLDVIDISIKNINSKLKSIKQEIKFNSAREKELKIQISSLSHLDSYKEKVLSLRSRLEALSAKKQRAKGILALVEKEKSFKLGIDSYSRKFKFEKDIEDLIKNSESSSYNKSKRRKLSRLVEFLKGNESQLASARKYVLLESDIAHLGGNITNIYKLTGIKRALRDSVSWIKAAKQDISEKSTLIKETQEKYDQLMPDVCPLCEQEIK